MWISKPTKNGWYWARNINNLPCPVKLIDGKIYFVGANSFLLLEEVSNASFQKLKYPKGWGKE